MPFKAPWSTRCSTTSHEQIVSAIELKLYASKNMHVSLVLASRRCIRRDRHAKRRRLHAPAWPRVKQEKEEEISPN